jgi:hypothetical protein
MPIRILIFLLCLATPVSAQTHLDLGIDRQRTYSIPSEAWVIASVPSVTVSRGGLALSWALYFDRGAFFEHDLAAGYEHERGRWTVSTNASRYAYRNAFRDWAWTVGTRFRVR